MPIVIIRPGFRNPMTAPGDMIQGGAAGAPLRLPLGPAGNVLTAGVGEVEWLPPSGGGGGVDAVGPVDPSPNPFGASIVGGTELQLHLATPGSPGLVSAGAQNIGGKKVFEAPISAGPLAEKTIQFYRELGPGNNTGVAMSSGGETEFFAPAARQFRFVFSGGPGGAPAAIVSGSVVSIAPRLSVGDVISQGPTTGVTKQLFRDLGAAENTGVAMRSSDDLELFIRATRRLLVTNGGNPGGSSVFEVGASGMVVPRLTAAQITALVSPADGTIVYCTDTSAPFVPSFYGRVAGNWAPLNDI